MNILNIIKRQQLLLVAIIMIALTIIGVTYAIFVNSASNKANQVVTTATLDVNYSGDCAALSGELNAMSDVKGLSQTGCTISFTNNSTTNLAYNINFYSNIPDDFTGELIDYRYVKASIDNGTPFSIAAFKDQEKNGLTVKEVYQRVIGVNETATHTIKVWLSKDIPDEEANKYLYLDAKIFSTNTNEEVNSGKINDYWKLINDQGQVGVLDAGDEVSYGSEHFNIIAVNGDRVKILTKYNLYVGYKCDTYYYSEETCSPVENPTNMQSDIALGYDKSSSNPRIGTVPFDTAPTPYWANCTVEGANITECTSWKIKSNYADFAYGAYVYDENASIKTYVDIYRSNLEKMGATILDARLLSYEEFNDITLDPSHNYPMGFVYNTSFWFGASAGDNSIMVWHGTSKNTSYHNTSFDTVNRYSWAESTYGVRPVLEIYLSDIQM